MYEWFTCNVDSIDPTTVRVELREASGRVIREQGNPFRVATFFRDIDWKASSIHVFVSTNRGQGFVWVNLDGNWVAQLNLQDHTRGGEIEVCRFYRDILSREWRLHRTLTQNFSIWSSDPNHAPLSAEFYDKHGVQVDARQVETIDLYTIPAEVDFITFYAQSVPAEGAISARLGGREIWRQNLDTWCGDGSRVAVCKIVRDARFGPWKLVVL
jgi:hypothetical protein